MFVLFTAEEIGLVGSRHIVQPENSPVPLEQIKAMLNLDMVGRLREQRLMVGGMQNAAAFEPSVQSNIDDSPLELQVMSSQFDGRSDHASYNNAGIPALFFFTGLHEEYHRPEDDVELINFEGLLDIVTLSYEVVTDLTEAPLDDLTMQGRPVRLGVNVEPSPDSTVVGVQVTVVSTRTPAARAGVEVGDIILSLDGETISDREDLAAALENQKRRATVPMVVKRGEKEVTLEVRF